MNGEVTVNRMAKIITGKTQKSGIRVDSAFLRFQKAYFAFRIEHLNS
ncbi:hypothetical protein [Chlorobium ferrooxidans]|nr:hypothetical protein [Chlorobium ferrooxidans]